MNRLQIFSLALFEKMPIQQALLPDGKESGIHATSWQIDQVT
jgi:hypothetical protein